MRTHDCEPTLDDNEVLDFCKTGVLMLEGVVPDEINQRVIDYLSTPEGSRPDVARLLNEDWFVDGVILNPEAAGAMRSLLGKNFGLPNQLALHRGDGPGSGQRWHLDSNAKHNPELVQVQLFYLPQAVTLEMGPTELLPGSHFLYANASLLGHYDQIRGTFKAMGPAGSIYMDVYNIWHRRMPSTAWGRRDMLKYTCWRTSPPERDWLAAPDFDVATADYRIPEIPFGTGTRDCYESARMFFWLMGRADEVRVVGGHSWPMYADFVGRPYWAPEEQPQVAV
jgi:hypothetical protein